MENEATIDKVRNELGIDLGKSDDQNVRYHIRQSIQLLDATR